MIDEVEEMMKTILEKMKTCKTDYKKDIFLLELEHKLNKYIEETILEFDFVISYFSNPLLQKSDYWMLSELTKTSITLLNTKTEEEKVYKSNLDTQIQKIVDKDLGTQIINEFNLQEKYEEYKQNMNITVQNDLLKKIDDFIKQKQNNLIIENYIKKKDDQPDGKSKDSSSQTDHQLNTQNKTPAIFTFSFNSQDKNTLDTIEETETEEKTKTKETKTKKEIKKYLTKNEKKCMEKILNIQLDAFKKAKEESKTQKEYDQIYKDYILSHWMEIKSLNNGILTD